MKPFRETAFGRTLAGQNNTGRWIHGIIDVAPIPNIHEVIKAVIKDEQTEEKVLGTTDIVKETFRRLDWTRTIVGSLVVVAFVMDWISVEKAEQIVNVLTGLI